MKRCKDDCKNCELKGCIKKGLCGDCGARLLGNSKILFCV